MLRAGELSGFAASTILYQAARFLFSLAAARALSPSDLTIWALVVALLAYAPAMLLGVNNGLSRELPILIGRGAESAAQRVTAATWSATTLAVAVIAGAAGIAAALAPPVRLEALLIGGVIGATIVFGVQQFVMRSRLRFGAASLHLGVFGAGALLSTAGLALWPDADLGTALALYLVPLAVGTVLGAVLEPPVSRGIDAPEIRRLAGVGFPIMLAGLVFSLFVTMDRWIAVWLLGVEQAAPYTLAALAAAAMLVVPTVVSQQTYPRMAVALGRGSSSADLRSMARRQGLTATWLALEHEVGRLRRCTGAEPELDRARPLRAQPRCGVRVETDAALRVRLGALHDELALDADDTATDRHGDGIPVEVDVAPLEPTHLATSAAGGGEKAEHERVLRVA